MPSDIQVTNIKAKDGTAGLSIANSTGNIDIGTVTAGNLSHADIVYPKGHWDWLASGAFSSNEYEFLGATSAYNNYRIIVADLLQSPTRGMLKLCITKDSDDSQITSSYKYAGNYQYNGTGGSYYAASGNGFYLTAGNIGGGNAAYFDIVISNLINVAPGFNDNYCGISWQGAIGGETYFENVSGGGQLAVSGLTTLRNGFVVQSTQSGTLNGQATVFGQRAY